MLQSTKLQKRQSEIRQQLTVLAGKQGPDENELRQMETLDGEFQRNEIQFRAALTAESEERQQHAKDFETRQSAEWSSLTSAYELRQAIHFLNDGTALSGRTAECAQELRSQRSLQGVGVPIEALLDRRAVEGLERRSGETLSTGVWSPTRTMAPIDLLYAQSVAAQMGIQFIQIDSGLVSWPVQSQGCTVGWANGETGTVGAPQAIVTNPSTLSPDHLLGAQLKLTNKSLSQAGGALEDLSRRELRAALLTEIDRAVFLGSNSGGQPKGLLTNAAGFGYVETTVNAVASYKNLRDVATGFLLANAAASHASVNLLVRHEIADSLDDLVYEAGSGITALDRLQKKLAKVISTSNALAAPVSNESSAIMTVTAAGIPPAYVGQWSSIDLIRDNITGAASGLLTLTALATIDVAASRASQVRVIHELQAAA